MDKNILLAILYELPLCKEYYDHWMAYQLANTILFSPAVELETNVLGTTVVTCTDFYSAVSEHNDLIPTIARRLVNVFLSGANDQDKENLVTVALETDPITLDSDFKNPYSREKNWRLDPEDDDTKSGLSICSA